MKTCTISVITAAYNAEKYIGKCIKSVLKQKEDSEHIIVDDGSTDHTTKLVKSFTNAPIQYIYQKNQGPAAARNAAIKRARGKYIIILDADDLLAPRALRTKRTFLEKHPRVDLVMGNIQLIRENGKFIPQARTSNSIFRQMSKTSLLARFVRGPGPSSDQPMTPDNQPMWRASRMRVLGHYTKVQGEDVEILIRAILRNFVFGFVPSVTGYYRLTPGGLSTNGGYLRLFRPQERTLYWRIHEAQIKKKLLHNRCAPVCGDKVYRSLKNEEILSLIHSREGRQEVKRFQISKTAIALLEKCDGKRNILSLRRSGKKLGISNQPMIDLLFQLFLNRLLDL